MEPKKSLLEKILLRTTNTEKFTEENRITLNSVFTDFKSIVGKLNDEDPSTFNGVANSIKDISDAKDLIIESKNPKDKKDSYNTYRDHLIQSIVWCIDHL